MPLSIGVSAAAGGGKSTLVRALGKWIDGAAMVFFDDHPVTLPTNPHQWLADGADFNEWKSDSLEAELESLNDQKVPILFQAPLAGLTLPPAVSSTSWSSSTRLSKSRWRAGCADGWEKAHRPRRYPFCLMPMSPCCGRCTWNNADK